VATTLGDIEEVELIGYYRFLFMYRKASRLSTNFRHLELNDEDMKERNISWLVNF
jgi:hypothetical protein